MPRLIPHFGRAGHICQLNLITRVSKIRSSCGLVITYHTQFSLLMNLLGLLIIFFKSNHPTFDHLDLAGTQVHVEDVVLVLGAGIEVIASS